MADPSRRARVVRALRDKSCRVTAVSDGGQLLERLSAAILDEDATARPDLIVIDVELAGCSAFSLLAGARDLHWETPFFLVVRFNDQVTAARAFELGADRVFERPVDPEELAAAAVTYLIARGPASPAGKRRAQRARGVLGSIGG